MHGVILLASFMEAGVEVLESEVTFKEQNLTQMANNVVVKYNFE